MKSVSITIKVALAAAVLAICTSVPAVARIGLVTSSIDEAQGLWSWSLHGTDSGLPNDRITSLQINLPIANDGITGGWKAWGPASSDSDGSAASDWSVELGDWQSSPQMSYVKWTAPAGSYLLPTGEPPWLYFYLQLQPNMGSDGIGDVYLTDSLGNVVQRGIGGLPTYTPEPSSLLALAGGLVSIGGLTLRRRAR